MVGTAFLGGHIFDGHGTAPRRADVRVHDGVITEVGESVAADGDDVVDMSGRLLLPGLIDCHVHVTTYTTDPLYELTRPFSVEFYEAARNLELTLRSGITTVRDAGGADLGIKVAQERGLIRGPRMLIAINVISQTGGHNDGWQASGQCIPGFVPHPGRPAAIADGPDEVRQVVRQMLRAGADVIKVATSGGVLSPRDDPRHAHFRPAELAVMVEEATAAEVDVMAHAGASDGIKNAVRAGVRSIEHGDFLDGEAIELMLSAGTWLVPTLIAGKGLLEIVDAGTALPAYVIDKAQMVIESQLESIRAAVRAGVRIAFGTDSGVTPHGENLHELKLMVDCGMTPEAALHAATLSAAQLLRLDDTVGSIEPGKTADLVAVNGEHLGVDDFKARIVSVFQAGELVA
jgi:imidazolonepropionase-like amidohydrolase